MLSDTAFVRVPTDGKHAGEFAEERRIDQVRFQSMFQLTKGAGVADGACGILFVDATYSVGAFEIPEGSLVRIGDDRWRRAIKVERLVGRWGRIHHWEVHIA